MRQDRAAGLLLLFAGLGLCAAGGILLFAGRGGRSDAPRGPLAAIRPLPRTAAEWAAAGERVVRERNCNFCHLTDPPRGHPPRDNCQRCHQQTGRPENLAPPLAALAERRPESWIRRYLRYPFPIRQNSPNRMPDFSLSDFEVEAVTRHLGVAAAPRVQPNAAWRPEREAAPDRGRLARGQELFERNACGNCHSLGDHRVRIERDAKGQTGLAPAVFAPSLDLTWTRVRPDWLAPAIRDPATWMSWSGMPAPKVTDEESRELAWYVMNAEPSPPATVSPTQVLGILRARCNGCHYGPQENAPPAANPEGGAGWLATWGARPRRLDLVTLEGLLRGSVDDLGNPRPAVVPFAENSPLLMHLKGLKAPAMPLGADPLEQGEIGLIERWILSGAPVPKKADGVTVQPPIEFSD